MTNEKIYHYSPRKGKIEVCKAKNPKNCPFAGYMHNTDKGIVQHFADYENEANKIAVDEIRKYTSVDWNTSRNRPEIFLSYGNLNKRVTKEALRDIGLSRYILEELNYNDFTFFAKTKDGIQQYLSDHKKIEEVFNEVNKAIESGEIGQKNSRKFDMWKFTQDLEAAHHVDINVLNRTIFASGINGDAVYNLLDVWNEYVLLKHKRKQLWEVSINNYSYYLFTVDYGPKRVEDAPAGYLGRELEKDIR